MQPSITYTIAMPRPHTHLYDVTLEVRDALGPSLDVALPVWTPGSYMVREYARHVQQFAAERDGQPLPWRKLDKATWRVALDGPPATVRVSYAVYADELSVRTSHLDATHGYFNPATLCMYIPGRTGEPLAVRVLAPEGWRVTTGLDAQGSGVRGQESGVRSQESGVRSQESDVGMSQTQNSKPWPEPGRRLKTQNFSANDYDELVDAPFECGTHRLLAFDVDGIPHRIALWGRGNEDENRIVEDTQKIVMAARDFFGGLPYPHYTFIVHLSDVRRGGLEHRNSVSMVVDRWGFQPRRSYERYVALTAHEFFHVWNVKRIRPARLGPFDYSRENYTRQLWTMEGVTDYYTENLLLRAGLIAPTRYRERLAEKIVTLQGQPGRAIQSLEQSSFDAWIKFYRPDENTPNSAISYYLKGALVALLLDLEIRQATAGARSLDDVLRYLYRTYPIAGPGFPEDGGYQAAVVTVLEDGLRQAEQGAERRATHFDVAAFFARYVAGTDELDYGRALGYAGLRLEWGYENEPQPGRLPTTLGVTLKTEGDRVKISHVLSDGPAYAAGVSAGDELLALDGFRVSEERLKARLAERNPGDVVTLSLFRRDELLHIAIPLAAAPPDKLVIAQVAHPSETQRQLYEGWIGPWQADG